LKWGSVCELFPSRNGSIPWFPVPFFEQGHERLVETDLDEECQEGAARHGADGGGDQRRGRRPRAT